MQIGPNTTVTIDYTLRLDSGEIVDSSSESGPLTFTFWQGQIIPGLERELVGLQNGDQKEIRVTSEEGYGERQTEALQQVPVDRFPTDITPEPGFRLTVRGPQGEEVPFTIVAVADGKVTRDFNHPLAGEALNFSVTVRDVQAEGGKRLIVPGEA